MMVRRLAESSVQWGWQHIGISHMAASEPSKKWQECDWWREEGRIVTLISHNYLASCCQVPWIYRPFTPLITAPSLLRVCFGNSPQSPDIVAVAHIYVIAVHRLPLAFSFRSSEFNPNPSLAALQPVPVGKIPILATQSPGGPLILCLYLPSWWTLSFFRDLVSKISIPFVCFPLFPLRMMEGDWTDCINVYILLSTLSHMFLPSLILNPSSVYHGIINLGLLLI